MEGGQKTLVQKTVPKPVRKLFRWMNFHFSEQGRLIYKMAKTLPEEQREKVVEHGKDLTTTVSKKNLPRGVRNVAASLVVGQGMWYVVCPALYKIDAVRESSLGWVVAGGLDKLFFKADQLLYQTGGASADISSRLVDLAPKTFAVGLGFLALELATDFSRCFIEYWSQKKYGLVADGAARAYGQVRPFPVRYSSLEAYQKMASYIVRPWAIGTPGQLFSSIYGIMGSIWRTTIQLGLVVTAGRAIDSLFKKISEWTGLHKVAERIKSDAAEREKKLLEGIRDGMGEEKFIALRLQIAAESRRFWSANPFRPALARDKAEEAAKAIVEYSDAVAKSTLSDAGLLELYSARLEAALGKKRLMKFAGYKEFVAHGHREDFERAIEELQVEHSLS